jgi:regulator of sigma E protease
METLITVAQVILSLSILVTLHECGHFFPARWFKTKVDKFFLFFDVGFNLWSTKIGETEYGIGWLPLGGYVKIAGMIDESMDKEQMKGPVQPWEFRAKPAWQRLIIMLGGVFVNFVLGFFILAMLFWYYGTEYVPTDQITEGIYVDSVGYDIGLRNGDKILQIGDVEFDRFNPSTLVKEVVINEASSIQVIRNGQETTVPIDPKYTAFLSSQAGKDYSIFTARRFASIDTISPGSTGEEIGLKKGDKILALNGKPIKYSDEVETSFDQVKGSEVTIALFRNNDTLVINKALPSKEKYVAGIGWTPIEVTPEIQSYGFLESFPAGYRSGVSFLGDQIKAFKLMGKGKIKAKESLGSVISIGKMFGTSWDWQRFWRMTAILSLILAVMNLLPIPALDGGHAMFLLWEWITGIKPSDKVMEYTTTAGFFILIALMIYVLGLDISRLEWVSNLFK